MEILTLLKANIRRKKETFISILLLTAIVTAMTTSIISVRDNYQTATQNAFEKSDSGDIVALITTNNLTDKLKENIENSTLVERVNYYESIVAHRIEGRGQEYTDTQFLTKMRDEVKLFNEDLSGFEDEIPELQKGEVYLPLGFKALLDCNVGDTLTIHFYSDQPKEFILKGFVQEPSMGAMSIGWKQVFISDEDYDQLYETYIPFESEDTPVSMTILDIHEASNAALSPTKFHRDLNLETKFADLSYGALNKDQSIRYSTLMPEIILDIVLAFVLFLFMVVLIIMSHSIATEIEIDYVTLGILKSQGFTKNKIKRLFLFQYLLTQVIGIIAGVIVSVPIEQTISNVFQLVTAVLPYHGISIWKCFMITVAILLISTILIVIKTQKIARISPIRAISGGREEIYFDSRFNAPIIKRVLLPSLSLRQFTSGKMRYIGTIFITALLVFSMIAVNLIGNLLTSNKALKAMGLNLPDVGIYFESDEFIVDWEEIDKTVESYSAVTGKNSETHIYAGLNGETLDCQANEYPEYITTLKGRAPIYDNEIVITEMVGELLEIGMGDEVTVSYGEQENLYIVSGVFQSTRDAGMSFAMSYKGAERIGVNTYSSRYYILEDTSKIHDIADKLKKQYGEDAKIMLYNEEDNGMMEQLDLIVSALKAIIYSFSLLFALIVVGMVCTRTFTQERTDIGIFKAIGFTSHKLRLNFAVRFMIIAAVGSVLGIVMSIFLSAKMLGAIFSLMGISYIVLDFTLTAIFIPVLTICFSFAVFAYLASRKVKKVAIRELVVE